MDNNRLIKLKLKPMLRLLWDMMGDHRKYFIVFLGCIALGGIASLVNPIFINRYFDLLEWNDYQGLYSLFIVIFAAALLIYSISFLGAYLKQSTMSQLEIRMHMKSLDATSRLQHEVYKTSHTGDLFNRIYHDGKQTASILALFLEGVGSNFIVLVVTSVYVLTMQWQIGLVLLLLSPTVFLTGILFRKGLQSVGHRIAQQEASLREVQMNGLQSVELIKAYGLEKWLLDKYVVEKKKLNSLYMRKMWLEQLLYVISEVLGQTMKIGSLLVAAWLAIHELISNGSVMAFFVLATMAVGPYQSISFLWGLIQQNIGNSKRVFALWHADQEKSNEADDMPESAQLMRTAHSDEPAQLMKAAHSDESARSTGAAQSTSPARSGRSARSGVIEFEQVDFAYREHCSLADYEQRLFASEGDKQELAKPVPQLTLSSFSYTIPQGASVAVVGESGTGKSTLAKLASGLYFPTAGSVLINSIDSAQHPEAVRQEVAFVSQDSYLFTGSVYENIKLGRLSASDEEIYEAAMAAKAHEFIIHLPDGYNTVVQEQGHSLSGGQRQRISIARALLSNKPVWVLDEITSALDVETESKMMKEIYTLAKQRRKTLLIVAHRSSAIQGVDATIALENGKVKVANQV